MAFNDAIDAVIAAQLNRQMTDPSDAAVRKSATDKVLDQMDEGLHRQRVETIGLISEKLQDENVPDSVKLAYERLLSKLSS